MPPSFRSLRYCQNLLLHVFVAQTSLRNADYVDSFQDRGETISLDRSWNLVTAELNVCEHCGVKTSIFELWKEQFSIACGTRVMISVPW